MKNWLKVLGTTILAFLSGIFYRMGGSGNYPRWVREVGVGCVLNFEFFVIGVWNWGAFLCLGSVWIESTYFKIKGEVGWFSWMLVGMSFSIATLPWLLWQTLVNKEYSYSIGYSIRVVVCTALTAVWQLYLSDKVAKWIKTTKDITDENGRGFIQIATLPLVLIH
jgi:hypothetical protein